MDGAAGGTGRARNAAVGTSGGGARASAASLGGGARSSGGGMALEPHHHALANSAAAGSAAGPSGGPAIAPWMRPPHMDDDELKPVASVDPSSSDGVPSPLLVARSSRDTFGSDGDELPAGGLESLREESQREQWSDGSDTGGSSRGVGYGGGGHLSTAAGETDDGMPRPAADHRAGGKLAGTAGGGAARPAGSVPHAGASRRPTERQAPRPTDGTSAAERHRDHHSGMDGGSVARNRTVAGAPPTTEGFANRGESFPSFSALSNVASEGSNGFPYSESFSALSTAASDANDEGGHLARLPSLSQLIEGSMELPEGSPHLGAKADPSHRPSPAHASTDRTASSDSSKPAQQSCAVGARGPEAVPAAHAPSSAGTDTGAQQQQQGSDSTEKKPASADGERGEATKPQAQHSASTISDGDGAPRVGQQADAACAAGGAAASGSTSDAHASGHFALPPTHPAAAVSAPAASGGALSTVTAQAGAGRDAPAAPVDATRRPSGGSVATAANGTDARTATSRASETSTAQGASGQRAALPRHQRQRSGGGAPSMLRNRSIEDFLSLVSSGDIPEPEHEVLSVPIFDCNAAGGSAGGTRPNDPSNGRKLQTKRTLSLGPSTQAQEQRAPVAAPLPKKQHLGSA